MPKIWWVLARALVILHQGQTARVSFPLFTSLRVVLAGFGGLILWETNYSRLGAVSAGHTYNNTPTTRRTRTSTDTTKTVCWVREAAGRAIQMKSGRERCGWRRI